MDERKAKKARLIKVLIEQGWSPPKPSTEVMHRILDDMYELRSEKAGFAPPPTLDLSPRQVAALQKVAEGKTRLEIADELGVGEETIKKSLKIAFSKLGARNAAHAVALTMGKAA